MRNIIRKTIKKIWGVDGISLFFKKQKKLFLKKLYTKKYTSEDLINEMCKMGMKNGSIVFIHCSMTEFYNYLGTVKELIDGIIKVIGEDGTLMMPAYPAKLKELYEKSFLENDGVVFDVNNTTSGAGYLSEVFRTYPGVKRSINLQHSVCAYGKLANYFLSEHHLSLTAWDQKSPYYKLSQMNTLVFSFGLSWQFIGTFIHCTESILKDKYKYFSIFFTKKINYSYKDENGKVGQHTFFTNDVFRKYNKRMIIKNYFDKNQLKTKHISNLRIQMVDAKYTLSLFLKLAELGITMYTKPSPKKYIINGRFIEVEKTVKNSKF